MKLPWLVSDGPINSLSTSAIVFFSQLNPNITAVRKLSCNYTEVLADSVVSKREQGAGRMDMYDSQFSQCGTLNEQIARQLFDILPEQGPVMLIMDRDGKSWASDSEKFSKLSISELFLKELCAKIDDGDEPIITQVNDFSIVAAQLATEQNNCGYVIIALPQYSPESTLINIDLIEILLNQIGLIATLIEKTRSVYALPTSQFSVCSQGETSLN